MIGHLDTYLINFSFIVIPLFVYQMFWVGKNKSRHKYNPFIIMFCLATSVLLCMNSPVDASHGIIYDFRFIPFVISVVYGGLGASLPIFFLMNLFRFFIGGNGFYASLVISTLTLILLTLFKKTFHSKPVPLKASIMTLTALVEGIFVIVIGHLASNEALFPIGLDGWTYIFSQALSMWVLIFFIQTMIENIEYQRNEIVTEKIKAISELAASISHEVRNPMTVVKGFLQMLNDPHLSIDKRRFYVKVSLTELERAEMIINDYLSMTKPQKVAVVATDLEEDIRYISNVVKPYSIMHNVTISELFDNQSKVRYDRNQFRQCLLNIMKNCIESMSKEGGVLTIHTYSEANRVILTIRDTGLGMSDEDIHQIGTPYFTTKEKGTGLGMIVVLSAIQSMGGKLHIEAKRDKGPHLPSHYLHTMSINWVKRKHEKEK